MKKIIVMVVLALSVGLVGCGQIEKMYEDTNYESITNERGDIQCWSGGVKVVEYKNAKIEYASADTNSALITDNNGKEHYWQGEMLLDIK